MINHVLYLVIFFVLIVLSTIIGKYLIDKYLERLLDRLWPLSWKVKQFFENTRRKKKEKKPKKEKEEQEYKRPSSVVEIPEFIKEKEKTAEKKKKNDYAIIKGARKDLEFLKLKGKNILELSRAEKEKFIKILLSLWAYRLNGKESYFLKEQLRKLDKIFEEKIHLGYKRIKEGCFEKIIEVVSKNMFYNFKELSVTARTLYTMESCYVKDYKRELAESGGWTEDQIRTKQLKNAFVEAKREIKGLISRAETVESITSSIDNLSKIFNQNKIKSILTIKVLELDPYFRDTIEFIRNPPNCIIDPDERFRVQEEVKSMRPRNQKEETPKDETLEKLREKEESLKKTLLAVHDSRDLKIITSITKYSYVEDVPKNAIIYFINNSWRLSKPESIKKALEVIDPIIKRSYHSPELLKVLEEKKLELNNKLKF